MSAPLRDERKITMYVWVACGISMLVIVGLWVYTLPWQFAIIERRASDKPGRWQTTSTSSDVLNQKATDFTTQP